MRTQYLALGFALAGACSAQFEGAGASFTPNATALPDADKSDTKRFVVQVGAGTNIQALVQKLEAQNAKVLTTFETDVFSGLAVESAKDNVDSLLALAEVDRAWNSKKVALPKVQKHQGAAGDSQLAENLRYNLHGSTGVSKLHDLGLKGEGVKIGVVDDGIDYTHPALGGGFGPGFKVAGGYDLVGDGVWPEYGQPKEPDNDPQHSWGGGHGTHVAGILTADHDDLVGVAPKATIFAYKVFSQAPYTDDFVIMEAFIRAYNDGVDIITCSIGSPGGFSDTAWGTLASLIVDQGIVVTISAGNEGEYGPFLINNAATALGVLAIASTEASQRPIAPFTANFTNNGVTNSTTIGYLPGIWYWNQYNPILNLTVVPITLNATDRAAGCEPLPEGSRRYTENEVVLIPKGVCDYSDKQDNVQAFGAKYVLFYNDDESFYKPISWNWDVQYGLIIKESGEAMVNALAAGTKITVDFNLDYDHYFVGVHSEYSDLPSYFTAMGTTYDLQVKPDIAAPGGQIWSTWPGNSYELLSGTSMATPYVAGVAALWINKNGGRSVHGKGVGKKIASAIIASGKSIPWWDGDTYAKPLSELAPVVRVGTGLVDASRAVLSETSVSYAKFSLNDTRRFERYHKVDITNGGKEPVTYEFEVQGAGVINALGGGGPDPQAVNAIGSIVPYNYTPSVSLPGGKWTLAPGETKTAQFNFAPPAGLDESKLPLYSGKILVKGSNGDVLSVPYFGVAANLKDAFRPTFFEGWPQSGTTLYNVPLEEKPTVNFDLSRAAQDFIKVAYRSRWAISELRWDIFTSDWKERSWTYPLTPGKDNFVGSIKGFDPPAGLGGFDPDQWNKTAEIVAFPLSHIRRHIAREGYHQLWWFGDLANGSFIQPGNYTMRFAALAPFGVASHGDNWDTYTAKFQVLPTPQKS